MEPGITSIERFKTKLRVALRIQSATGPAPLWRKPLSSKWFCISQMPLPIDSVHPQTGAGYAPHMKDDRSPGESNRPKCCVRYTFTPLSP